MKSKILCMILACIMLTVIGCSSKKDTTKKESSNSQAQENVTSTQQPKSEEKQSDKIAYLTFDDGPSQNNTTAILEILKKYEVHATFFVLPHDNMDDLYKQILNDGNALGNHSFSHETSLGKTGEDFRKDVLKSRDYIYNITNYTTTVFRFPGGSMGRNKAMIQKRAGILKENGYRYFDWDVSVADTDPNLKKYGDEDTIVNILANNVVKNTKDRKRLVILMHDSPSKIYTLKALPQIIEGLKEQGYSFDILTNYKD